jgi:hypothetical protein
MSKGIGRLSALRVMMAECRNTALAVVLPLKYKSMLGGRGVHSLQSPRRTGWEIICDYTENVTLVLAVRHPSNTIGNVRSSEMCRKSPSRSEETAREGPQASGP